MVLHQAVAKSVHCYRLCEEGNVTKKILLFDGSQCVANYFPTTELLLPDLPERVVLVKGLLYKTPDKVDQVK